jgi:AcrR family transcriptional regulator
VAAEAGVGKGTIFQAFGNQRGLLDALRARKLATLREAVEQDPAPLGPGALPRERAVAFLDALLTSSSITSTSSVHASGRPRCAARPTTSGRTPCSSR